MHRAIADGTLAFAGCVEHPAVRAWQPRDHPVHSNEARVQPDVVITITERDGSAPPSPAGVRTLRWGQVDGWVDRETLQLRGQTVWGDGDLSAGRLALTLQAEAPWLTQGDDAAGALLLAAGVLLGAQGHLLLHAGAVLDEAGRAWLLAGDTHSGKSTTVATLSAAGVPWVCDDTLLLRSHASTLMVHGWVRRPHLDAGFADGQVLGRRVATNPGDAGPFARSGWTPVAPVGGVLLPRVCAEQPTRVEPATALDTFGVLVRQGPWAGALPPVHATRLLALLSTVASLPAYHVRLGRDSYGQADILRATLRGATSVGPMPVGDRTT